MDSHNKQKWTKCLKMEYGLKSLGGGGVNFYSYSGVHFTNNNTFILTSRQTDVVTTHAESGAENILSV